MKHASPPKPPRLRQRGQSLMEYTVVCAALAVALFVPVPGADGPEGSRTTVQILLDGFRNAYQRFSFTISLPN